MSKQKTKFQGKNMDLPDSADDKKHLQPDEGILNLPDVKDIPGQEHVRPLLQGEMADTTISSADEEADDILGENDTLADSYNMNITKEERDLLKKSSESMATSDDLLLQQAALDKTDDDGTPLNEETDQSGNELDVPGSEEDDSDEEDEENNSYSLSDDKEDEINTRQ